MTALDVQGVSHAYGPKTALQDVSLKLAPGTFCCLLGPNGAGKSTLFRLVTRLAALQDGAISVAGHDITAAPLHALAQIGVVFQEPTLDLDMSVMRNMRYFAGLHGLSGHAADTRIDAALTLLSMESRKTERVRALNGGHRRRMEIARALIPEPKLLLLDEPTVGLDADTRARLVRHVHDLAGEGIAVLWATHLVDEVYDTDRVVILHEGRVLRDDTADRLAADTPLLDVFLALTGQP